MNISRREQRVLHVLSQGGHIRHQRDGGPRIIAVTCLTPDGLILSDCDLSVFARLRSRGLIESRSGSPYRISRRGREAVRAQFDNRG